MSWKPIASAPKDRPIIVLDPPPCPEGTEQSEWFRSLDLRAFMAVAHWVGDNHWRTTSGEFVIENPIGWTDVPAAPISGVQK